MLAALYSLAVFSKRRKAKAHLHFAVVSIIVAIRIVFIGERFFISLFPGFNYILSIKIMVWTFYLYVPFIVLFIDKNYGGILGKRVVQVSNFSAILYFFLVLILLNKYYSKILVRFEIFALLMILYMVWKVSKIYIKSQTNEIKLDRKRVNISKLIGMVIGRYLNMNYKNGNIVYVVEDLVQSVSDFIESKGISIIFDTEVEEKIIAFDEEKMERIILNLLSNAVKFTSANGSIFVTIHDKGDFIEISIRDTGIGIPEDKLEFIFERFAQVDKSLTRKREGSGIGLSLVKSLVEIHGGTICAKSKLGQGSEFIVTLPVKTVDIIESEELIGIKEIPKSKYEEKLQIEFSDIYL